MKYISIATLSLSLLNSIASFGMETGMETDEMRFNTQPVVYEKKKTENKNDTSSEYFSDHYHRITPFCQHATKTQFCKNGAKMYVMMANGTYPAEDPNKLFC